MFANELAAIAPFERYYDAKGIRTRCFEKGEGQPVILLHGGGGHADPARLGSVLDRTRRVRERGAVGRPGGEHERQGGCERAGGAGTGSWRASRRKPDVLRGESTSA